MQMRNTSVRILIILTVVVVISYLFFTQFQSVAKQPIFTKEEAEMRVEELYVGEVKSVSSSDDTFIISFEKNASIYEVHVHKETGVFSELVLIHDAEQSEVATEENNEQPGPAGDSSNEVIQETPVDNNAGLNETNQENPSSPPKHLAATLLSEQKIIAIAQKQMQGEVDAVEFYETADGGYYLVEIETSEEEATFQIHAITGKILSISFDD